jgi:hypothetical protein
MPEITRPVPAPVPLLAKDSQIDVVFDDNIAGEPAAQLANDVYGIEVGDVRR